jgi:hypothetical protein
MPLLLVQPQPFDVVIEGTSVDLEQKLSLNPWIFSAQDFNMIAYKLLMVVLDLIENQVDRAILSVLNAERSYEFIFLDLVLLYDTSTIQVYEVQIFSVKVLHECHKDNIV